MARKPLRSQLNQIRAWVRQGRTDAWIAHQLEISASELREFRRRHELSADEEGAEEEDLRDEIEAEIEAATLADTDEEAEESPVPESEGAEAAEGERPKEGEEPAGGETGRRRRRRRRRGRGRGGRVGVALEATFDHGEDEGIGLWLDPAVTDDPVYAEHWAGHRPVEVSIEPERITIRRVDQDD